MQGQPKRDGTASQRLHFVYSPLGIAVIYFVLSSCWVLLSQMWFVKSAVSGDQIITVRWLKGISFVVVNAVILFFLIRASLSHTRKSEQQLAQHHSEVDLIFRNLPGMLYRAEASGQFPIQYASDGAERLTGMPADQLAAKKVPLLDLIEEEDKEELLYKLERARTTGTTFHSIHRIRRTRGGVRHVLHDGRFHKDESGSGGWLEGLLTDMTAEVESLQSLRDSEERLRVVFERSNDALYIFQDKRFVLANPRFFEIFGYTSAEVYSPGFNFLDLVAPEEREKIIEVLSNFEETGTTPPASSVACLRKDGTRIQIESSVAIVDWDGKPAVLSVIRDVTHARKMEKLMSESQRLESVGRLAGGVAHDFNNLLTSVTGNAELAEYKAENGEDVREELREIRKVVGIASNLTRRLLTFSRQQPTEAKQVRLNDLISDIVILVQRLVGSNIRLEMDLSDNIGNVLADGAEMEQVLINLVVNARDAMAQSGGTLTIRTQDVTLSEEKMTVSMIDLKPGRYVCLEVEDTGEGMTPAIRERIFEPFFTTKDQDHGTGFGLATVFGIVNQAGGGIDVESVVGEGSRFSIYLPALEPEAMEAGVPKGSSGDLNRELKILLVDDDETVRKMLVKSMSAYGLDIQAAADGEEAMAVLSNGAKPFDLLITDVMMPGMDGMELSRQVLQSFPDTKIILMSGYTSDVADEALLAEPSVTFVNKPVGPKRLTQEIRDTFGS